MVEEYAQLLETYHRMFDMVDTFHFNSQNTADVYRRYLDIPVASKVIPITHGGILDHRRKRAFDSNMLRLGFIGSEDPYKGLPMLKEVIRQLNQEGLSGILSLVVYGGRTGVDEHLPNVRYKGRFCATMLEKVYDDMDLLIVPSICNETFSLVTLEALSYGVPVSVSDMVGAKDVVTQYDDHFVFKTKENLYALLKRLVDNKTELIRYNDAIVSRPWQWSMEKHAEDIVEKLYNHTTSP